MDPKLEAVDAKLSMSLDDIAMAQPVVRGGRGNNGRAARARGGEANGNGRGASLMVRC